MRPLELYLHIHFCVQKCKYCDFLSAPAPAGERREYVESLCRQIRKYHELAKAYHVVSIFIGGGTPSLLESCQMERIVEAVRETFLLEEDVEFTIEANPGTLTMEKLETYRKLGVNRLSLGLQSADNDELKRLGRIHTYEEFLESFRLARQAGFGNINVDLMSGIPGQTLTGFEHTLKVVSPSVVPPTVPPVVVPVVPVVHVVPSPVPVLSPVEPSPVVLWSVPFNPPIPLAFSSPVPSIGINFDIFF